MRHADACRIVVRLTRRDHGIGLRVEDDGTGFEPTDVPSDRFGLVGMRERARLLGGTLTVESGPDAGTAIEVAIPTIVRPVVTGGDRR
jgi:signal transduction histidine kinase